MSELDNFIRGLSDHELAIFHGYRYENFLKASKVKIEEEIKKRKLSAEKLNLLLAAKLNKELSTEIRCCPRCNSEKLFIETDYKEIPVSEFSSAEVAVDSFRCRLCGFNAGKSRPKNLAEKLKRIYKKTRIRRINKWNEI